MKLKACQSVISYNDVREGIVLNLNPIGPDPAVLEIPKSVAYVPLINAHDHLVGNWFPRAGDKRPYPNSHIWVEDMKDSFSFHERSKFWHNDGSFKHLDPAALAIARLGAYKNLFSGCSVVQDHGPLQEDAYYDSMPILVPKTYRQCHSITLGNWWGGETAARELELSRGEMPFIIHLGEGTDEVTQEEFSKLEEQDLLKPNTLMIHGIAFTKKDIRRIAEVGASVCWCPTSNYYLIGKTLDIESVLEYGANVVIGTDSTMSGAVNLIREFATILEHFPQIEPALLYKMVTVNAVKALYLAPEYGKLNPKNTTQLLLTDQVDRDPFLNLVDLDMAAIKLLVVDGIPRYGDSQYLELFPENGIEYTLFRTANREKFVIGDPLEISEQIDAALGYHKDFPFLPF
jgi:hypothetical protein